MCGQFDRELGRPALRKRRQESDEPIVAVKRVMTVERRGSTCKRKRFKQMSENRLRNNSNTEEEIREIAARQGLVGFPHLALMREKLSVKAKNEPKFRFYNEPQRVGSNTNHR